MVSQGGGAGYGGAQNNLAIAYALGQGVPKDLSEAYKWFALGLRTATTSAPTSGKPSRRN